MFNSALNVVLAFDETRQVIVLDFLEVLMTFFYPLFNNLGSDLEDPSAFGYLYVIFVKNVTTVS